MAIAGAIFRSGSRPESATLPLMQQRPFGSLGAVSALTLGGGGTGQVWGATTRDEAIATTREAVESGITLLDLAPGYGNGEAESVIGETFGGRLPAGVRITTKCMLGNPPPAEVASRLEASLAASLGRMRLSRVDLFFLHGQVFPDDKAGQPGYRGSPLSLFREHVRPTFERLVREGRIGAWGISAAGIPESCIAAIDDDPPPNAAQVVINLLDSPGGMKSYEGPARPRDILAAANRRGVAVMGIRAVQAGALTDAIDRPIADDHPEMVDYRRAAPFRAIAKELGESPASLAHRYALSVPGVATVVLGVKNRTELRECIAAEAMGPLDAALMARIDASVGRA